MTEPMGSHRVQSGRLWRAVWRFVSSPRPVAGLFLALALCAALGTLLPQQPPQVDLSTWTDMIQQRYGGRAHLYASLGLFRITRTPLFIALVGALVTNTLACTARRAVGLFQSASIQRATHRPPRVIQSDAFYRAAPVRCCLSCPAPFALPSIAAARSALSHHHYRVAATRRDGVGYLYAERHRWARWATLVTHGAVVLLSAALLLRSSLAWRDLRVQLVSGQVYPVGHHTPWEVRLDRFSSRALEDGRSVEYQAHLTLLAQGQPVAEHRVGLGAPLSYRGLRVHLFSFGPAVRVRAASQGQPVALKPLWDGESEEGKEVFLTLSNGGRSQGVVIPSHDLQLHFDPQLGAGGLFVEATQGEEGKRVWSGPLPAGGRLEAGDLAIEVRREAFVVVDLVHDPTFLPVIVSAALMVGGLSCTFAFPTHQLWVRGASGEMWIAGRTSRDPLGFERHFRRLAREVEARLTSAGRDAGHG